jgi:hypothetical protein
MLLAPDEIESYQAPWTVGAPLSVGDSAGSTAASSSVCAARCVATTRDGASGNLAEISVPPGDGESVRAPSSRSRIT